MNIATSRHSVALAFYMTLILVAGGCSSEHANLKGEPASAKEALRPYGSNTVGYAASEYLLTMPRVRVWFDAVAEMQRTSQSDSTLHLKLNYPFDSDLNSHVASLEQYPSVMTILRAHGLTPREFVVLSTLIGTGLIVLQIADSAGTQALPVNIDRSLLAFMTAHRAEFDSLKHQLDR